MSKATFKSYLDPGLDLMDPAGDLANGGDVMEPQERRNGGWYVDPQPRLIPGELILAEAKSIIKYSLFTDQNKGLNGSLFCTNFRLAYVTSVDNDGTMEQDWKINRMLADNDVPLSGIESVFQVTKGKRKKLLPRSKVSKRPKVLEIHCRDFRVHFFCLKYSDKMKAKQLVNEILKNAYPESEKALFGFNYRGKKYETKEEELTFQTPSDWEFELQRLNATQWKTVQINQSHNVSLVLPEILVVPSHLRAPDLKQAAMQFIDSRLPTWCYTTTNQASLVRMAYLLPETEHAYVEEMMIEGVKRTNPKKRLQIIDLSKQCPPFNELKMSQTKLREICLPLSTRELRQTDNTWYSGLENSRWLVYVAQCIELANSIANAMTANHTSIIIRESDASDYCCVIASLVQLLVDPFYRTRSGFEALVRKEWICMGHRFLTRLGLIVGNTNVEPDDAPIFILFLDCVWQILQQYPAAFEFSETYLTALADSTHFGVFVEFMFDNQYQSRKWARECGKYQRTKFLSVWNWSLQFSDKFQSLFVNPLYEAEKSAWVCRPPESCFEVLQPSASMPMLSFWAQCYLRWLSPIAIIGGGNPSEYLSQCKLAQEIQVLQDDVEVMLHEIPELRKSSKRNDLFLSFSTNSDSSRASGSVADVLTSSFPYTPLSPKQEFTSITARTIDAFEDSLSQAHLSFMESDCAMLDD